MATVNWKYWLIAVVVGPTLATLAMLGLFGLGSVTFSQLTLIVGPALFGSVFAWCLRASVGLGWRQAGILVVGLGAAHILAYTACFLSVDVFERLNIGDPYLAAAILFTYGGTFALAVAGLLAWLFSAVRSLGLAVVAILAAGFASLVYLPLYEIFPGFIISNEAASITFGVVYASGTAILGWPLLQAGAARAG